MASTFSAARPRPWLRPLAFLTVWTTFATTNAIGGRTTTTTTQNAACAVGDSVEAIWGGDGGTYPAVINSINKNATITVDWEDDDATFRTIHADKVRKAGVQCDPVFEEEESNVLVVILCAVGTLVTIIVCGAFLMCVDKKISASRDANKVVPLDSQDKFACAAEPKVTDKAAKPLAPVESRPEVLTADSFKSDSAPQSAASAAPACEEENAHGVISSQCPKLGCDQPTDRPGAYCHKCRGGNPLAASPRVLEQTESAVPPEPKAAANPTLDETRLGSEPAPAPLNHLGTADLKVLSAWEDGVAEEPLSDSDHETTAAQSEESV